MHAVGPTALSAPQYLGADALLSLPTRPGEAGKIDQAARGLEGVFLTQLLKEMRQTLDPETLFGKDGGDVYGGLFDQFMAQHLVQSGGVGLAAMIKHQLEPRHAHEPAPHAPTVRYG